jgi:hypothetical protein
MAHPFAFFEVNGCIQSIVAPDEVFFSIYESVFPGRIRGYYLLGSYSDATSVSISDIDMAILFLGLVRKMKQGALHWLRITFTLLCSSIVVVMGLYTLVASALLFSGF